MMAEGLVTVWALLCGGGLVLVVCAYVFFLFGWVLFCLLFGLLVWFYLCFVFLLNSGLILFLKSEQICKFDCVPSYRFQ